MSSILQPKPGVARKRGVAGKEVPASLNMHQGILSTAFRMYHLMEQEIIVENMSMSSMISCGPGREFGDIWINKA